MDHQLMNVEYLVIGKVIQANLVFDKTKFDKNSYYYVIISGEKYDVVNEIQYQNVVSTNCMINGEKTLCNYNTLMANYDNLTDYLSVYCVMKGIQIPYYTIASLVQLDKYLISMIKSYDSNDVYYSSDYKEIPCFGRYEFIVSGDLSSLELDTIDVSIFHKDKNTVIFEADYYELAKLSDENPIRKYLELINFYDTMAETCAD